MDSSIEHLSDLIYQYKIHVQRNQIHKFRYLISASASVTQDTAAIESFKVRTCWHCWSALSFPLQTQQASEYVAFFAELFPQRALAFHWMQHKTLQVPLDEGQDNLHDSETTRPGQCVAIHYRALLNALWMWLMNRMPSSLFHKTDAFYRYLVNPTVNKSALKMAKRTTTFQGPNLGMSLVFSSNCKSMRLSLISIHTADVMNGCCLLYLCKTFKTTKSTIHFERA